MMEWMRCGRYDRPESLLKPRPLNILLLKPSGASDELCALGLGGPEISRGALKAGVPPFSNMVEVWQDRSILARSMVARGGLMPLSSSPADVDIDGLISAPCSASTEPRTFWGV